MSLVKRGYDLNLSNLNNYYNGGNLEDCKKALDLFAVDLWGKYAEDLKATINLDWLADDLIKLENEGKYCSDFTITFPLPVSFDTYDDALVFERELSKTQIINMD